MKETNNLRAARTALRRRAEALVAQTAFAVEAEIKVSMAAAKSGKPYTRRGTTHQASAPGEAPAIDTGNLANSIQVDLHGLSAVIGTNAEYAEALEFGTVRMAPRPFLAPAMAKARPHFKAGLKQLRRRK